MTLASLTIPVITAICLGYVQEVHAQPTKSEKADIDDPLMQFLRHPLPQSTAQPPRPYQQSPLFPRSLSALGPPDAKKPTDFFEKLFSLGGNLLGGVQKGIAKMHEHNSQVINDFLNINPSPRKEQPEVQHNPVKYGAPPLQRQHPRQYLLPQAPGQYVGPPQWQYPGQYVGPPQGQYPGQYVDPLQEQYPGQYGLPQYPCQYPPQGQNSEPCVVPSAQGQYPGPGHGHYVFVPDQGS